MLKCWKEAPNERPAFAELVKDFDSMLQVGTDYLDLNFFSATNMEYFISGAGELTNRQLCWDDEDAEASEAEAEPRIPPPTYLQMQSSEDNDASSTAPLAVDDTTLLPDSPYLSPSLTGRVSSG